VARSQQHGEVRTFKVDRISAVSIETLKFQMPADFNLQTYLQDALGVFHSDGPAQRVVIRFAPEVARYVEEHHWHTSQRLMRQSDGSLLAELELAALEEVKSWVLSFGSKAVVEEPEELRAAVLREAETLWNHYTSDSALNASRNTARARAPTRREG
jgi:predicted DNA-binding transcriptional regulator YafY